jgi:hypothetical protein
LDNAGYYVVAGYLLTVGALAAYVMRLFVRARRARARTAALAADRRS